MSFSYYFAYSFCFLVVAVLVYSNVRDSIKQRRLDATGISLRGTVTSIRKTNTYRGAGCVMRISLEVIMPDGRVQATTCESTVDPAYMQQRGYTLAVKVDRDKPSECKLLDTYALQRKTSA